MPDELTVAIQEAIAWARGRCERCWLEKHGRISSFGVDINTKAPPPHTCDGDLAIVERVARAAAYRAATGGALDSRYEEVIAKIRELRGEGDAHDAG